MAKTIVPFYNVSAAVGRGCANRRTDVMLVQYMLFRIIVDSGPHWQKGSSGLKGRLLPGGPGGLLPHDGLYSPRLGEWIVGFQQAGSGAGLGPMTTDGVIGPAPVGWGRMEAKKATWFTIQAMNLAMYNMSDVSFSKLSQLADVPSVLAKDLDQLLVTC